MSAVYLATHIQLNRQVALKILQPPTEVDDEEGFHRRFQLEAETLAGLHHPNIVVVHDYGETKDGRFFLAMEYIDGPRFTDLLRDGGLTLDRILKLVLQVCAALRYAHKRGVIHRDIKPSNLLVRTIDEEEMVKVVDFGLVKLTEGEDQTITRAGMILGSPRYMAPEQIRGQHVDERTDIYAIGILLYRSITGVYPFQGANSTATMLAHLHEQLPSFFTSNPDVEVPVGLEEVVTKCLAKDPAERYDDVRKLIEELVVFVDMPADKFRSASMSIPAAATGSTLANQVVTERTNNGRGLVIGGIVGMLVLVFIIGGTLAFLALSSRETPPDEAVPTLQQAAEQHQQQTEPEGSAEPEGSTEPEVVAPEAVVEPEVTEPEAVAAPEKVAPPTQKPRPVAMPRPVVQQKAEPVAEPTPEPPPEEDGPEGYMELPDDF